MRGTGRGEGLAESSGAVCFPPSGTEAGADSGPVPSPWAQPVQTAGAPSSAVGPGLRGLCSRPRPRASEKLSLPPPSPHSTPETVGMPAHGPWDSGNTREDLRTPRHCQPQQWAQHTDEPPPTWEASPGSIASGQPWAPLHTVTTVKGTASKRLGGGEVGDADELGAGPEDGLAPGTQLGMAVGCPRGPPLSEAQGRSGALASLGKCMPGRAPTLSGTCATSGHIQGASGHWAQRPVAWQSGHAIWWPPHHTTCRTPMERTHTS